MKGFIIYFSLFELLLTLSSVIENFYIVQSTKVKC